MDASIFSDMAKKTTSKWTKQRKKEERDSNASWNRYQAMTRTSKITVKDVAYDYMERAYMKASANGTLPAVARQVMYAARGDILDQTGDESLDGAYFQTLLKDYMLDYPSKTSGWDIAYDARGNFHEPHTDKKVPLGTLSVRDYLRKVRGGKSLDYEAPGVMNKNYPTIGSKNRFSAVMFIEKEGFMPLLDKVVIANMTHDELVDLNFITNRFAREGHFTMKFNSGIQQPVGSFSFDCQVDTQVCTQKQIRLTGFNRYANRGVSAVQVPCLRQYIVFCHNTAGSQGSFLALNR